MSYLTGLLSSKEPLDDFDRDELIGWLATLRADCEIFGAAAEDSARMAQIRHRLGCKAGDPDPTRALLSQEKANG